MLERVEENSHLFERDRRCENRCLVTSERCMREVDRCERNGDTIITTAIDAPGRRLKAVIGRNPASNTTWTIKYPVETLEEIESIRSAGAPAHVHCHGNVRSTLELVIQREADLFEPVEPPPDGDITLAEAKAVAARRITLGGNVESRRLEMEDAAAVEEASRKAFEGDKTRMVFQTTSGPIRQMTPKLIRNYHRLIDVWEELSPISDGNQTSIS
jgi:hypothetical protein